ncbi:MAG: GreA/GreB family elongation factor [bacterium]
MPMDKAEIITQLRARNQEEFDTLNRGKSVDTDPDRVAKRLEELKHSLEVAQDVLEPKEQVEVGSLVVYEEVGKEFNCLVLPGCMGDIIEYNEKKVACVSPDSHIALAFISHRVGDEVQVQTGKITRKLKIKSIL